MISDLHNDFPTAKDYLNVLENYSKSRHEIVGAVFKGKRSYEECYELAESLFNFKSDNVYLAYEDFSYDVSYKKLEKMLDLEPVYVTLTWNGDCVTGGGAGSENGLTRRGRDVIKLLNERGIFVDLAHLSKRGFYEVVDIAEKVLCSHTAFCGVNEHIRNLDDDQLRVLGEKNAFVGLAFYPYFLNGTARADVNDVVKHIDHFVALFGDERLCVGSDFYGCEVYPENMSDYSFEGVLRKKLYAAGYSVGSVDRILFDNLAAVLRKKRVEIKGGFK